ncbi:MAG TPA: radical SAM protein [Candidatus Omnitrophota bacterium]|nr:radical SAM protein [Candidatus Omnitrophota bacterium]
MADRVRPYLFYDVAISICSRCYRKVEGKILFEEGRVYLKKRCPDHGWETALIADDVEYYRRCREIFLKAPEQPNRYNTPIRYGCPYDCGLCPDHEQHSCLSLIEITDQCNLTCPICYASSGTHRTEHRTLEQVERMMDAVVANEREPDVVQISGGEPTIHPEFFAILDAARRRPIRHLMVNTNGIRIAREPGFAERLAQYMPGFELYLQFDSFRRPALMDLRGADLRSIREGALRVLNDLDLSTTLVVTVKKGVNDGELGAILDFAASQRCVRGVTFQPVQAAGRVDGFDPERNRLTLTEVRRAILEQSSLFRPEDLIPVPCHPDCLAMAYALKSERGLVPLTGLIDPKILIEGGRNTIIYEQDRAMQQQIFRLFATNHSPDSSARSLRDLLCCLPRVAVPESISYRDVFRVIIMQFLDAHSFDVRSVKKSCVHIVHPDGRLIPFDNYNLFYRDRLERERLAPLRELARAGGAFPGTP